MIDDIVDRIVGMVLIRLLVWCMMLLVQTNSQNADFALLPTSPIYGSKTGFWAPKMAILASIWIDFVSFWKHVPMCLEVILDHFAPEMSRENYGQTAGIPRSGRGFFHNTGVSTETFL